MLTKCPECELQISDKAVTCPHCGYPLNRKSKNPTRGNFRMRLPNGFGQITELKNQNLRNRFRAMVTVGKTDTGKPICKILKPQGYFHTYNEAYEALIEYNKDPYSLDEEMSMSELYDKWTSVYFQNITSSSMRTIKSAWSYCSSVYSMRPRDIRVRHIKGCMESVESTNIKNRIKSMFNLMMDYALEMELIDKNYARDFKVSGAVSETKHIAFTDNEMEILWKNTPTPLVNLILVQCYTGWRPQELCKIKLSDVNIDKWYMKGGMKTKAGIDRVVPICERIKPLVKKIYAMSESLHSEYFVCDMDGSEMTYDKYYKRFKNIITELKLDDAHRPHDPRKQFITMCKSAGVDEYAIKRMAGHSIDDITEKLYTERDLEWLRQECEKISSSPRT